MAFFGELFSAMGQVVSAPFKSFEALWIIIPLFLVWFILEIYFGRFKKEELGWNTSLANGITLGWLTLGAMRFLFELKPDPFVLRFALNIGILLYALLIVYFSFTHKISSKWNFILASPTPVYYFGMITVCWGFGTLGVNWYILLAILIVFILVSILIWILRKIIKPSEKDADGETPSLDAGMGDMPSLGGDSGMPSMPDLGVSGPKEGGGPGDIGGLPPIDGL